MQRVKRCSQPGSVEDGPRRFQPFRTHWQFPRVWRIQRAQDAAADTAGTRAPISTHPLAASGIVAGQGVAVLAGGLLADLWTPATAIAVCGAAGVVVALAGALAWRSALADDHAERPQAVGA